MLRQLSLSHDNEQSMAIHPKGMKPALSVAMSHHNVQSMVIYP